VLPRLDALLEAHLAQRLAHHGRRRHRLGLPLLRAHNLPSVASKAVKTRCKARLFDNNRRRLDDDERRGSAQQLYIDNPIAPPPQYC
jgi:hypothetical protein